MSNLSNTLQKGSDLLYREQLKRNSLTSIDYFTEQVLGFKNKDFHKDWYGFVQDDKNHALIILAPRSHAKTTCLSINYPLWLIAKDPNIRIILVSNTISQSQSYLREITSRIEQDRNYKSIFGKLKPPTASLVKWTDSELVVARSAMAKDATISCCGTGGSILTKRADIILADDILDAENTATREQRKKVKEWFLKVLLPCLEPDGKLIVVGTRWCVDDLYGDLLKDKVFQIRETYKAVKEDGTALWEEKWSLEKLKERKLQMGSLLFNQQYQNEAISQEDALFKKDWIKFYEPKDIDIRQMEIFGALDPAISKKETADFSVFLTIGVDKESRIYVLDVARDRLSVSEQINLIIDKFAFYKHEKIGIEAVAFQSVIKAELDRISQEKRFGLPTTELRPDRDKYRRASALSPFFENGIIYLRQDQNDLIDELLEFPAGRHDDTVDALGYAIQLCKESPAPRMTIFNFDDKEDEEEEEQHHPLFGKIGKLKKRE